MANASDHGEAQSSGHGEALKVDIKSFGPTSVDLERVATALLSNAALSQRLEDASHRLLSIEAVDQDEGGNKEETKRPPTRFRASIFDYASSRTLVAEGAIADPERIEISESKEAPPVSWEEFRAAVDSLGAAGDFKEEIDRNRIDFFRPMPPAETDERGRRLVNVGLIATEPRRQLAIVGVDLGGGIHRHGGNKAGGEHSHDDTICGAPVNASQPTASQGTAGQVSVTVSQGNTTLWTFDVVRPAASSGLRGSGVELRYVHYRGKSVLYRAHVPILNVKYDGDACGPYRDWQYEEGQIQATGADVAPGFRFASAPVQTIMDTGSDTGNFLGVGIYVDGQEVVLVSEMEAGWYRYLSEWRLHSNGTIRPRFGFAATESSCVCNIHHHHAYWRLDFDIVSAGENRIREYNKFLCLKWWKELTNEVARPRSTIRRRKWRVEHTRSGAGYEIRPSANDGIASQMPDAPYGRGDMWFLRYRGSEIDDGVNHTSGAGTEANIAKWVNGEQLSGQDVVVWYGAHFSHDVAHQDSAQHGHILGPELVPINWPS